MNKEIAIYTISDSIGETSQKLIGAVMVQYPDVPFRNAYRFPFVTDEQELVGILKDAKKEDAIVISTLVNQRLAQVAKEYSLSESLAYYDLMQPFFSMIEEKLHVQPIEKPGIVHKLDTEYFQRISAIEFAVKYDDGKNPQGFLTADAVILGVSRTSKTPLSMYLANRGHKIANLPLIPEVPVPQVLDQVDSDRIIGLICQPEKLVKIRSNRLESLGLGHTTSYTDVEKVRRELAYAQSIFKKYQAQVIDVTDKSIEETAYLVEEHLKRSVAKLS